MTNKVFVGLELADGLLELPELLPPRSCCKEIKVKLSNI